MVRAAVAGFAVFIPADVKSVTAQRRVAGLQYAVNRPLEVCDQVVMLTTCIGVSGYPQHGHCFSKLLRGAGLALRKAKRAGGGRVTSCEACCKAPHLGGAVTPSLMGGVVPT